MDKEKVSSSWRVQETKRLGKKLDDIITKLNSCTDDEERLRLNKVLEKNYNRYNKVCYGTIPARNKYEERGGGNIG